MSRDPQEIVLWHNHNCATIKIYELRTIKKEEIDELERIFQSGFAKIPIDGVKILIISHAMNHLLTTTSCMMEFGSITSILSGASSHDIKEIIKRMIMDTFNVSVKIVFNLDHDADSSEDEEFDIDEQIGQSRNSTALGVDQEFTRFDIDQLTREINEDLGGKSKQ